MLERNRDKPRRYEIVDAAGSEATVYLYDMIDPWFGVAADQFVKDLNAISAKTIHLRVNSPGGDVFDGRAIATAIRQHPANVIAHIDGLAASAASFVALAANEVEIAAGAMVMIHRASVIAWGNAEDLLSMADVLEKIDASLVAEYAQETGQDPAQIRDWLDAETWFTAEEAVANGFADRLAAADAPAAQNVWDLSAFRHAPASDQQPEPAPAGPDPEEAAQAARAAADHRERQARLARIA